MQLKSKTILSRKPRLKIKSNHLRSGVSKASRHWVSSIQGTAVRDGKGWYIQQKDKK